jgi:hypothetical protein
VQNDLVALRARAAERRGGGRRVGGVGVVGRVGGVDSPRRRPEAGGECALREQPDRIGATLRRRALRVHHRRRHLERVARGLERAHQQCAELRREPPAHDVHAIVVRKHGERPRLVPLACRRGFVRATMLLPRAHHPLELRGGGAARELE